MRNMVRLFFVIVFMQGHTFAMQYDKFQEEFKLHLNKTKRINERVQQLKEEDYTQYVTYAGPCEPISEEKISNERIKNIKSNFNVFNNKMSRFDASFSSAQWKAAKMLLAHEQPSRISQLVILPYCEMLPLVMELEKDLFIHNTSLHPITQYTSDLEELFNHFDFLSNQLLENESMWMPFMMVKKFKKNRQEFFEVNVNQGRFYVHLKQRARYLKSAIGRLNFTALDLPKNYQECLFNAFNITKNNLEATLKKKLRDFKPIPAMTIDMCSSFSMTSSFTPHLDYMGKAEQYFNNPLHIAFSDRAGSSFSLSPEERQKNFTKLDAFYNFNPPLFDQLSPQQQIVQKEHNKPAVNQKNEKGKRQEQTKKTIEQPQKEREKKAQSITPLSSPTQSTPEIEAMQPEALDKEPITQPVVGQSLTSEVLNTVNDTQEKLREASTTSQPVLSQPLPPSLQENNDEDGDNEDEINFNQTYESLLQLLKAGYSLDNSYIVREASSLMRQLTAHPELVEQIQEAISGLSVFKVLIENQGRPSITPQKLCSVPKNAVTDYDYFMMTPLRHLKGKIDFGSIKTLLGRLDPRVNIDDKRAGSRIHITLKDQSTSIHLHKKTNGMLDSGRIFSLRQLIFNAGFYVSDQ